MLGIDPSTNMLVVVRENSRPEIEFRQMFVEEFALKESQYDLVVSSRMFHYIEDLNPVSEKIHSWLREGGSLVFLIEHPIVTAIQSKRIGWLKDDQGERIGWEVTDYSSEVSGSPAGSSPMWSSITGLSQP